MLVIFNLMVMILLLAACSDSNEAQLLEGYAQGTTYHIRYYSISRVVDAAFLQKAVNDELIRIDKTMSGYRADSIIEQFNAAADTAGHAVGAEIVGLVKIAHEINIASKGCYDITLKPMFELWGFAGDRLMPPNPQQIARVMGSVGMEKLEIASADRLRKLAPFLQIDLSSIAQGYSATRIAAVLDHLDIHDYMVEIGGEVVTAGQKPDGQPWRIAIERPLPGGARVGKVVSIHSPEPQSVVTSGTYRHFFDDRGTRYSHILDARTGSPVMHDTVSVTVVHSDASIADAWSTALLCLGAEQGLALADQLSIPAVFIQEGISGLHESHSRALSDSNNITVK